MKRKIYLIKNENTLQPMEENSFLNENRFQVLLEKYPDLLAGDQIDENNPRRWLLVSREIGIPSEDNGQGRWFLDHLFLDQDAVPTLIEVKRSNDTRIRREVIGQMLDYAANAVVFWSIEYLRTKFEEDCNKKGENPFEKIANLIETDPYDRGAIDKFWHQVKTNLQAGKIRLIFVSDEIPTELSRVVEFLNTQMDPAEVLAVEIKQYIGPGVQTLVPNIIGRTAGADKKKGPTEIRKWDEKSFLIELAKRRGSGEASVAQKILDWAKEKMPSIWWGEGKIYGGFIPGINHNGKWHQLIEVWTYGSIELQFQYMKSKTPPFDIDSGRLEFIKRLNKIDGINIPDSSINKRPSIPLSLLTNNDILKQFFDVLNWAVQEIVKN